MSGLCAGRGGVDIYESVGTLENRRYRTVHFDAGAAAMFRLLPSPGEYNVVLSSVLAPTAGRVGAGFAHAKPVTKMASGAKPLLSYRFFLFYQLPGDVFMQNAFYK